MLRCRMVERKVAWHGTWGGAPSTAAARPGFYLTGTQSSASNTPVDGSIA